jgi:hypothetical protein
MRRKYLIGIGFVAACGIALPAFGAETAKAKAESHRSVGVLVPQSVPAQAPKAGACHFVCKVDYEPEMGKVKGSPIGSEWQLVDFKGDPDSCVRPAKNGIGPSMECRSEANPDGALASGAQ